jgi:hypothetical protein
MNKFLNVLKSPWKKLDSIIKGEVDYDKARTLLPFFYYFLFVIAFLRVEGMNHTIAEGAAGFVPRWPLFWAHGFPYATTVSWIFLGFLATSLLASFFPNSRTSRIGAFLGMLAFHAYSSSFGGPNHQYDLLLWISLIFVFLPKTRDSISHDAKRAYSLVFWCAQTLTLLTYTMSGIGKVFYGLLALVHGNPGAFSPDSAALHVASLLNTMHETTPLGPTIVAHPWFGFIPFIIILYVQVFSVAIAFKPQLHRIWGLALILFQISTYLAMRAVFVHPSIPLLLLFVSSPFLSHPTPWREALRSLPLIGRPLGSILSMNNRPR